MKREFIINITFLLLVNLLIKPVYVFFIDARAQDVLGTANYGQYFALFNLAYILTIFADLGLQNYNSRTIAQNKKLLPEYLPGILGLKILLSTAILCLGILLTLLLGYEKAAIQIFSLVMINQIMLSFILYLRTNISASGKYRWDSLISVIDKLILIILLGTFLYTSRRYDFNIYQYILSHTSALILVLLIVVLVNRNLAGRISLRFDLRFSKDILTSSIPYSLVILLMAFYLRIDGFLLERLLPDPTQAGVYAASYRIFDAFNNVGFLFAVLLLPMFASLLNDRPKLLNIINTGHNLMLFIAATASVLTIVFSQEIMSFLYPDTYTDQYRLIISLMMPGFLAVSMNYIYGTLLTAAGRIHAINRIVFIAAFLNLIMNLILIPAYGATGAAVTGIITHFFVLAMQYILSLRYLNMGFDMKLFFKRIAYLILLITISFALKSLIYQSWIFAAALSGLLSLIMAYSAGFIKISDFKNT